MALSAPSPVHPPINEDFLFTDALDFHVENNGKHPFYKFVDSDALNGVSTITYFEFARAAHRLAHLLRPNHSDIEGEVVALLLHTDTILYQAAVAGLIVAGCVPFPISPRNSAAAIVGLLEKTSCRRILVTEITTKPLLDAVKFLAANTALSGTLRIDELPSLTTAYPHLARAVDVDHFERYRVPIKRPSKNDIIIILHSSGSTGTPRPIPQTHLSWIQMCSNSTEFQAYPARLVFACMSLPSFHAFGAAQQLFFPVFLATTAVVYPPATVTNSLPVIPSPENTLDHTKRTGANVIFVVPAYLQIWSTSPDAMEFLKNLEFIVYAGGPLAPRLGNLLVNAGVRVHPVYGGTEFGSPTYITPTKGDEEDWQYFRFRDSMKIRWVPQGDGTFECEFLAWEKHVLMMENLPDTRGYATSDLFEPHPTKTGLWKLVARKDDVVIHSSGEKTVPGHMELLVLSSPLVQGAIIFGQARDQTGILIEPRAGSEIDINDHEKVATLRNKLWPIIEEANQHAPAFSRIFKEMILVTSKTKPLPRAGKGTVMRKAALILYDSEITALYDSVESNRAVVEGRLPASWSKEDVESWIVEQATDLISGRTISRQIDLFDQGFDSLSATFLRLRVVGALKSSNNKAVRNAVRSVAQNLIYSFPVIKDLAAHVTSLYLTPDDNQSLALRGTALMDELITKYGTGLETNPSEYSKRDAALATVLLTGSTGHLGSQLLGMLLMDERVEKVYTFNRPSESPILDRHLKKFSDIGLDTSLLESQKLVFLIGDTSQSSLSLDRGSYSQLCKSVNIVIHNAWRLDFNINLTAFEPNIRGTRNLIDLVKSGPNASDARFLFISSVATALSWDKSMGPVPERVVEDTSVALGGGYGESKHVAERILAKSDLQVTSFRVGQISGGQPRGAWSTTEWVPILVKSSVTLGILPDADGMVSWLSAKAVAMTIVDIALANRTTVAPRVLNLVHPRPTKWTAIVTNIRSTIQETLGHNLRLVSFSEWISAIETRSDNATAETLVALPAIKLLEFFRGLAAGAAAPGSGVHGEVGGAPTYSTDALLRVSDVMRRLPVLQTEDIKLWIDYWCSVGFLA